MILSFSIYPKMYRNYRMTDMHLFKLNEVNKAKMTEKGLAQETRVCEVPQTVSEVSDVNQD